MSCISEHGFTVVSFQSSNDLYFVSIDRYMYHVINEKRSLN